VIVVLGKGRRAGGEQEEGDHRAALHFKTPSSPYVLSKQRLAPIIGERLREGKVSLEAAAADD
jgi:hypothetical protein